MSSPVIAKSMGEVYGWLKGKVWIRNYWEKALIKFPSLHFEIIDVLAGANSVTIL